MTAQKLTVSKVIESAGGIATAAKALGLPSNVVWNWCDRDSIPANWVLAVSKLTGVPPHKLRPDVFAGVS